MPEHNGMGFIFAMSAETVREGEQCTALLATTKPIPVPEAGNWLPLLSEWAALATGMPMAIPTIAVSDTIPEGTPFCLTTPPGQTIDRANASTGFRILTKFRILWPLGEDGLPDEKKPELREFDRSWHERDGSQFPESPFVSFDAETWTLTFDTRYPLPGAADPAQFPIEPVRSLEYYGFTGQESDALVRAASDGATGRNWRNRDDDVRLHQAEKATHHVEIALTDEEKAQGYGLGLLENLTASADADTALVFYYSASLLAPPPGATVPEGYTKTAWLDIDDVAEKIETNFKVLPQDKKQEARRRAYGYIRFIARARVRGQRNHTYVDKDGRELDTRIEAPAWSILAEQKPAQPSLFVDADVPVRVEIAISTAWVHLLRHDSLAQFLPSAERLSMIPGNKPGGAYARAMGLVLFRLFRINPRAAVESGIKVTREELLTRFTPRGGPVQNLLESDDPGHAVKYYAGGLQEMVDAGLIAPEGEATPGLAAKRLGPDGVLLPRKGWQKAWMATEVRLHPGPVLLPALEECAQNLPPVSRPKRLPGPRRPSTRRKPLPS